MRISYNKLWHLMKINKMTKKELASATELSKYAMAKLNNNKPVSLMVVMRLCKVFHCDIGDMMELIEA